jgi:hypothetical protein
MRTVHGHFTKTAAGDQIVVWSRMPNGEERLRAYVMEVGRWRCVAIGRHPSIFDLQAGDIDHDGLDEIVVGLRQRSKLDPRVLPRIHVYSVDAGRGFRPRWRGSSLSRPFRLFRLMPVESGCDLVAVETSTLPEYKAFEWVSIYRWKDFGVHLVWDTPVRGKINGLQTGKDSRGPFVNFTQVMDNRKRVLVLRRDKDKVGWHAHSSGWACSAGHNSRTAATQEVPLHMPNKRAYSHVATHAAQNLHQLQP